MNGNHNNWPNLSIDVTELSENVGIRIMNLEIDRRLAIDNHHHQNVIFGQAQPPPMASFFQWIIPNWMKKVWVQTCLLLVILLFGCCLFASKRSALNIIQMLIAAGNTHQDRIINEENECDCDNTMKMNKLNMNIDEKTIGVIADDSMNVQEMFKEDLDYDHLTDETCTLYDVFLHVFTKLSCLKNEFMAILKTDYAADNHKQSRPLSSTELNEKFMRKKASETTKEK